MRTSAKSPILALVVAVPLLAAAGAPAQPAPDAAAASLPKWAQASSDLSPDPGVRFGVLPNGMRYAIMRNATPAGATALRLRIGSGSLEESDDEQGLAHVLEHMAFRGSKNVPPGEMVKILQREGLAFGPDTNAQTEWTQTVYMLDIPHSDPKTLDTGLMLMRETAGNLLIQPDKLATERGVVLSEERLRDTPNYRAEKAELQLFLQGQLASERFPIGKVDIIKDAPASLIRKFYEQNYRPDRATLIAVGDFDPAVIEARMKALFSDWAPAGPPTATPDLGTIEKRGLTVREVPTPGASTQAIVAWVRPYDSSPDTETKEIRETIENLGLAVLNNRLNRLAQGANPPFLSAGASFENLFDSAKIAVIEANSPPDGWKGSLTSIEREVRELVAYGVAPAELQRAIDEYRAALQSAVAGAATRPTSTLADELVRTVDENEVFTPPTEDLRVFNDAVKGLTPEKVNAAIRGVFAGSGPLVALADPQPVAGGEAAVGQVFKTAQEAPLAPATKQASVTWPYTDFGKPGTVANRREIADLGVTEITFANGVRLTVKPTQLRKDQVLVTVNVGSGRLELPKDRPDNEWTAGAFLAGGFGKLTSDDAARALAGKVLSTNFQIEDDAFQFAGSTRPQDLATQMQFLTAYVVDPGFRPEALERERSSYLSQLPQMEATPNGVFYRDSGGLMRSGDPRFAFPTHEQIANVKPDALRSLLQDPLSHGRIEVTMVGDISVDQAVAATAATFGALPPRPIEPKVATGDLEVQFPAPTDAPVMRFDTGRPDQAVAVLAWPETGFFVDMKGSRAAILAGEVLGNRLLDKIRIAQGMTYSPETNVDLSETFPAYGFAINLVEMPPASIPDFFKSAEEISADIAANGVTEDELVRARNPRIAGIRRAQLTNEYWITSLTNSQADPRRLDLIRSTFPDYESITAADVQAAAKRWFRPDKAWEFVVEAKPSGPTAAAGAAAAPN
ncbi:MAG TPA: insulinase family protein [Caulobacteraceae bacterium]|jgi:zinc protease